ncbi:hypothetical protein ACFL5H_01265 [Candidatus Latescibacterota bacterium]
MGDLIGKTISNSEEKKEAQASRSDMYHARVFLKDLKLLFQGVKTLGFIDIELPGGNGLLSIYATSDRCWAVSQFLILIYTASIAELYQEG